VDLITLHFLSKLARWKLPTGYHLGKKKNKDVRHKMEGQSGDLLDARQCYKDTALREAAEPSQWENTYSSSPIIRPPLEPP